ncbi:MAG: type II toxin-antitoxin system Phd/YefM family antitoxin [Candidatus Levybacteria bacterium]|nr:type II toxin-antitoxin system Phd/YefM family antitoxin [Candidatus Levybacteria bacterium]MBI2622610.1 type II toxin-antitoxin system Phd/YefM family antitoxin [Candidatus Levybacteria bacterium]MBI3069930.1 type II toxin-antitoxin system Phd/YefM family antitoxin [Candidatus Levybacteria bacterium]MBI3092950.1 type II toxin-antitoxin system Phd/YefM family antitoxin [Candidatus Levybacteria bacterium]
MILSSANVKTISDMRENARELLKQVQKAYGPLYILYRSKPQAVLLSLAEYQKLADMAEDYLDSLRAQEFEAEDKKKIKWLSFDEVK